MHKGWSKRVKSNSRFFHLNQIEIYSFCVSYHIYLKADSNHFPILWIFRIQNCQRFESDLNEYDNVLNFFVRHQCRHRIETDFFTLAICYRVGHLKRMEGYLIPPNVINPWNHSFQIKLHSKTPRNICNAFIAEYRVFVCRVGRSFSSTYMDAFNGVSALNKKSWKFRNEMTKLYAEDFMFNVKLGHCTAQHYRKSLEKPWALWGTMGSSNEAYAKKVSKESLVKTGAIGCTVGVDLSRQVKNKYKL